MIDKIILIDLYINKRKTSYEIAEMFGVNRTTVCDWLHKYEIDINPKQRKYEIIKKVPFTQEQKDLIVGTLLGDGCIALHGRKNKACRLMIGHCEKQKDFLMWKKAILGNFVNAVKRKEHPEKNSIMWNFTSVVHDEFRFYRTLFYEGNKKVIRDELIHYLKPLSLAVWFLDDGTLNAGVNMRFSTDCFTKEENEKLQWMLKCNFDIRCKVCEYTRNDKKYYYLSLNKENSLKMTEIIAPYSHECMKYKLINRSSTTERQTSDFSNEKKE
jgi:recombination protein RecA